MLEFCAIASFALFHLLASIKHLLWFSMRADRLVTGHDFENPGQVDAHREIYEHDIHLEI
jgi:hypothetical protein